MEVVNFGSLNLDYVYRVPRFVSPGETLAADSMKLFPGGKGLNQSIAIARAGARVSHAGCTGKNGEDLKALLEKNGVNTQYIKEVPEGQGHALIQVNREGENCILIYGGSNQCLTEEYVDSVLDRFGEDTFVVLQNETNQVGYIMEQAWKRGMKVVFNPSPIDKQVLSMSCEKAAWLLVNEVEAEWLGDCGDTERLPDVLEKKLPHTGLVLTKGKQGCTVRVQGKTYSHPAYPVAVVDSTAAGDTFTGYFIAGLSRGEPMDEVVRRASAAAALAVSREGASPSIPWKEEVEELLESMKHTIR